MRQAVHLRQQVTSGRPHWLTRYGVAPPDGRPLHRYRVDDEGFDRMQENLRGRASVISAGAHSLNDAATFTLWAAEWFRRRYTGGLQRWADLGAPIAVNLDQAGWRRLADDGLDYWKLPPLLLNGTRYRLVAIARQGGFPVAALEQGEGWIGRYLQALVRRLLAEPDATLDMAAAFATDGMEVVPETWRSEEMRAVCAELALAAAQLRRSAEAAGVTSGGLVSAWLDKQQPDWREALPVTVDAVGGRALVDGLVSVAVAGGGGTVRAQRLLRLDGDGRREQLSLELDGALRFEDGGPWRELARTWSRLRVFPSGTLAHYVASELAVVEPDCEGVWRARPVFTAARFDVPFSTAVTVELRGEGRRVAGPLLLPGGEPLASELRVCAALQAGDEVSDLRVVGAGSGGYSADPLHLDIPEGWTVRPADPASAPETVSAPQDGGRGRRFWRVSGAALVTGVDEDRFLVRSGQAGDARDRIVAEGERCRGLVADDGDLLLGTPTLRLLEGGTSRNPREREAWWRPAGDRAWQAMGPPPRMGACEFAWRHPATGHIRARADAIVLPRGFAVTTRRNGDWLDVRVEGWPHGVSVQPGAPVGPGCWRLGPSAAQTGRCEIILSTPSGAAVRLQAPLPHHACIVHWRDGPAPRGDVLSLASLSRHVARVQGGCDLVAELLDGDGRPRPQAIRSWRVEDELPLSAIFDEMAALLRPCGIDARARLSFRDGREAHWCVSEFEQSIRREPRGWVPDRPVLEDARVTGRGLGAPTVERDFGLYRAGEQAAHRPLPLPELAGAWLIYLRANDRVLSRPRMVVGEVPASPTDSPLGRAMQIADAGARGRALDALAEEVTATPESDGARRVVRELVALAASLNGLPPSTFDVFARLRTHPLLGPAMLFAAAGDEVEPLLRLADGLELVWPLVGRAFWDRAFEAEGRRLFALVPDPAAVAGAMGGRRFALAEASPVMRPLLGLGAAGEARALDEVANAFLNRSADRVRVSSTSPFRPGLDARLPRWSFDTGFWRALDAPVAAAAASRGEWTNVRAEHLLCIREILRDHPRWFAEAFALALALGAPSR